jgi:hypothetical protein
MPPVMVSVVDQFTTSEGVPDRGVLRFRPLVPLRFSDSVLTIGTSYQEYTLDSAGKLNGDTGIPLVANDSPNLLPLNTCWVVRFDIQHGYDTGREYPFLLYAADTSPVNLAARIRETLDLQPGYLYALQSDLLAHEADLGSTGHAAHLRPDGSTIIAVGGVLTSVGGTGDKHYVHTQNSPATVWTITHNLNKHPAVTVVDSAGSVYEAEADYPTLNTAVVTLGYAFSGVAYCN